jgi:hypothetical protein
MSVRATKLLTIYRTIKTLHERLYVDIKAIKASIPKYALPKPLADGALITRKCQELLDDSSKMLGELQQAIEAAGVMVLVQKGDGEPLKGDYASAYGKPAASVTVPSHTKDPAKYQRLCEILGVPYHPLTRLHWPSIKSQLSEILASGDNLPAELNEFKQYTEPRLIATARGNELDTAAAQVPGYLGEP